jgi:hypothetical protein
MNRLRRDPQLVARFPHAAFDNEVVEKLDDTICWSGVAFEVSARMLGSDRRH